MICSLTFRQYVACRHWATERHEMYLAQAETVRKRHRVAMPIAGWWSLTKLLQEQAFTRWGKGRPSKLANTDGAGTRSAFHAIHRHLAEWEGHPALRDVAVIGCSWEVIPVWKSRMADRHWQVTPAPNEPMMFLMPEYDDSLIVTAGSSTFRPGEGITRWWPRDHCDLDQPGLFKDPDEHMGW